MGRLSKTQNHKEGLKVNGPEGNHFSHGLIPSMKECMECLLIKVIGLLQCVDGHKKSDSQNTGRERQTGKEEILNIKVCEK